MNDHLPIDLEQLDQDLKKLKDAPDISLTLTACEAMIVLCQIQLACRHPENSGSTRNVVECVGRHIQNQVATTPALHALAEKGWRPNYQTEA